MAHELVKNRDSEQAKLSLNVKLTSVPAPLANTLFTTAAAASNYYGNDGIIYENLEKSTANKELNDKKRLATIGANFARAYTMD
ncbi:hypothetical protein JHK84_051544 [Glycine max]|nr:hypothetical protein JHK84_051544 [Glycine max]